MRPCHDLFWFSFSLVAKVARVLLTNHRGEEMADISDYQITFDTQLKTAISTIKESEISRMILNCQGSFKI